MSEKFVMYSLGYTISRQALEDDAVLRRPMYVRWGWLHAKLHSASYRFGFHDWLIAQRWYRWWSEQRYGPTMLDKMANELRFTRDRTLLDQYSDLYK